MKFVVVGDECVGKTSIAEQLINHTFKNKYVSTIAVGFYTYIVPINDKAFKVHIWDTSGRERSRKITRAHFPRIICALIVYDITNRDSFTNASTWLSEIRESGNNHAVIMLVGNKSDQMENRVVTTEEATYFAEQNNLFFIEVSAQTRSNIDEAFMIVYSHINENIDRGKYDLSNGLCGIKL
ncbi:hypothetical protein SteCoe_7244 [Stentor coeruleus]|uniref:Uncharacterized protein n=1 Tax=Stentor coeruleus TaxID=5963 RepID=A0A1R2CN93_9CILI|nr:hypothetical protein SteCoe_7244 [Stentor coeruleus]